MPSLISAKNHKRRNGSRNASGTARFDRPSLDAFVARAARFRLAVAACIAALGLASPAARAHHVGVNVPGGAGSLALVVGPVSSPTSSGPADVTFSLNPRDVGNGVAVAGAPAILIEVGVRVVCIVLCNPTAVAVNATAPAFLTSGADQIPISEISWTVTNVAGHTGTIPNGSFTGGPQEIYRRSLSVLGLGNSVHWYGGVLTFRYANTTLRPAGTYTATVTYTADTP